VRDEPGTDLGAIFCVTDKITKEDALLIEFSPTHDRAATMEHAAQMMAAAAGA